MERKAQSAGTQSDGTKVLERGLMVLGCVATTNVCTVREISAEAGLSRTATYRILESLCRTGFLYRNAQGEAYRQTGKLLDLAAHVPPHAVVADVARPILADTTKRLSWPLLLGYLDGIDVVVVETTDHMTKRNLKRTTCGQRIPQYLRAAGAVCKAALDPAEARLINKKTIEMYGDQMLTHSEAYRTELLNRVRQKGFVIFEPLRSKESSIAVPVKLADRTTYGLEVRFLSTSVGADAVKAEFLPALQHAAARIAKEANALLSRRNSGRA